MAGDHPDVPFLQASKYSKGRTDGPPLWVVVHDMEEHEVGDTAERVANYFHNLGADDRDVSSHYTMDSNSVVQCVRLADTAWTVGNRPGNRRGINYELAGFASQTAAQWADAYSTAMLRIFARIAARDMTRYNIPARWCTVADLKAFRPGLTTHNDLRLAFGQTTHTDPGPNFPKAAVLAMVQAELTGDDMPTADEIADAVLNRMYPDAAGRREEVRVADLIRWASADAYSARQLAGRDLVNEPEIVAGVLAVLTPEAIAAAIPANLAQQVADELAARLAE